MLGVPHFKGRFDVDLLNLAILIQAEFRHLLADIGAGVVDQDLQSAVYRTGNLAAIFIATQVGADDIQFARGEVFADLPARTLQLRSVARHQDQ